MYLCHTYQIHQYGTNKSQTDKKEDWICQDSLWGFIDGTIWKTDFPLCNQQTIYTRFKKCHGIKFQSVHVPDGYIACLFSPVPPKIHDVRLLCESNLIQQLHNEMPEDNSNGPIYSLYGDLVYPQFSFFAWWI